jgi:hypothetical protein
LKGTITSANHSLVKNGWCWWYRKYAPDDTVLEGLEYEAREGRPRFDDLIEELKNDYILKRHKTWKLREQYLAHLKPVFGGMRAKVITTPRFQAYVTKRLEEEAAPATVTGNWTACIA